MVAEDISGWGGGGGGVAQPASMAAKHGHYVTPSAKECSHGTLGYVPQALITVLKARLYDTT